MLPHLYNAFTLAAASDGALELIFIERVTDAFILFNSAVIRRHLIGKLVVILSTSIDTSVLQGTYIWNMGNDALV